MARKIEKKICTCCGKELQLKEFYKSASTMYDGKLDYLGSYSTKEEAFQVYKNYKEKVIKEVIDSYEGRIPEPFYSKLKTAMYNYEVEITD